MALAVLASSLAPATAPAQSSASAAKANGSTGKRTGVARPDLRIGPASLQRVGDRVRGTVEVRNQGRARARSSQLAVVLQSGGRGKAIHLDRSKVVALAAGKGRTTRFSASLAPGLTGTFRVRACADRQQRVRELDEQNNCRAIGVVRVGAPGGAQLPLSEPWPQTPATASSTTAAWIVDTTAPTVRPVDATAPTVRPVDTTPPAVRFVAVPDAYVADGPVELLFSADDDAASLECSIDAGAFGECRSPLRIEAPSRGLHTVSVRARDIVGNVSDTISTSWRTVRGRQDLCGEIASDMTLSPDDARVYVSTCPILVPEGRTLTLESGTVLKVPPEEVGIQVAPGGVVRARGSEGSPAVLTSYADDSVGGDTNADAASTSPADAHAARLIETLNGGTIDLSHATLRHADHAIEMNDGVMWSTGLEMSQNSVAIQVNDGRAAVRGTLTANTRAIRACNWGGEDCVVDASHVDWGHPSGPMTSSDPPAVCGAVTVDPWIGQGEMAPFGLRSPNCDGSTTPLERETAAAESFNVQLGPYVIDCGHGFQDACAAVDSAMTCLRAAHDLAVANLPVPIDLESATSAVSSQVAAQGSEYLKRSSSPVVSDIGSVTSFAGKVLQVASTIASVANAYDRCAP